MMRLALFLLAGISLAAETPKPPQITPELRARFWRAQAEQLSAQMQAQRAAEALRFAQEALVKACGPAHDPVMGADGEPVCEEKLKPKPPGEK